MYVWAGYTPTVIKTFSKVNGKVRESCSDYVRTSAG